jgi:hypothetical protein
MRSSSASIDLLPAIIFSLLSVSCASGPPAITPSEVQADIVGVVTISGEHPYERQIVLADTSGVYWLVESPEYEGELLELGGQTIRALGLARTEASGYRSLLLRWYDLRPAPGRIAGVGVLERWGDDLVLFTQREGRPEEGQWVLIIDGPLRSVLESHIGYRVWVSGESVHAPGEGGGDAFEIVAEPDANDPGEKNQGEESLESGQRADISGRSARISLIRIVALEYGVLGPPIPSLESSPRNTLPDSSKR